MCFWRIVFLFSLYYSLANIFSTQAGSNLLLYKLIRWKTFSDVLFKTEVRVLMWERNWRLSIYSKEISHLWGSCSGPCPNRKSNDLCSPGAGLFIRPVYLGLNPKRTWKGCGSSSVGDSLLPVSVLAWLAPASPFAGCCAPSLTTGKIRSSVKKINFSRSSLSRPNAC